jgi:hypothetical protein
MSGFPTDLLVYGAVALMILLFNFLGRKAAAQQAPPAQDPGEDEALAQSVLYEPDEPPSEFWGRVPPTTSVLPVAPERPVHAERPRVRIKVPRAVRRYDRASLFGSKADVRKAIVLMTVLGPPRGAERREDTFRR